jgi:hypothetical protein
MTSSPAACPHALEMIQVQKQQRSRAGGALRALELLRYERFPADAVEQPGQAVGAAQCGQHPVLLAYPPRKPIGGHADQYGVRDQQRQARHDVQHAALEPNLEAEGEPRGEEREHHPRRAAREEARAPNAQLVHREHHAKQDARQQVEIHQRDPHAAEGRVRHQAVALDAPRVSRGPRHQVGRMRPDKAVQEEGRPGRRMRAVLPEHRGHGEETQTQTERARHPDTLRKA